MSWWAAVLGCSSLALGFWWGWRSGQHHMADQICFVLKEIVPEWHVRGRIIHRLMEVRRNHIRVPRI